MYLGPLRRIKLARSSRHCKPLIADYSQYFAMLRAQKNQLVNYLLVTIEAVLALPHRPSQIIAIVTITASNQWRFEHSEFCAASVR